MEWQSDPVLFQQEMERRVRRNLSRTAIVWTPLFIAALPTFAYFFLIPLAEGELRLVALFLFGGLSVLCGFQAISAIRDLRDGPRTVRGMVARAWKARDALVVRTYYIRLHSRQILRGDSQFHGDIRTGDYVEATYFPRSSVLVFCSKLERPVVEESAPAQRPAQAVNEGQVPGDAEESLRSRLGL